MNKIEKIKGWVARDEDDGLHFFVEVPKRYNRRGVFEVNPGVWSLNEWRETHTLCLDRKSFSDLKWEDEPLEVELTIKRVSTLSEECNKSLKVDLEKEDDAIREDIISFIKKTLIERGIKNGKEIGNKWISYLERFGKNSK